MIKLKLNLYGIIVFPLFSRPSLFFIGLSRRLPCPGARGQLPPPAPPLPPPLLLRRNTDPEVAVIRITKRKAKRGEQAVKVVS